MFRVSLLNRGESALGDRRHGRFQYLHFWTRFRRPSSPIPRCARAGRFQLSLSDPLLAEIIRVLRDKFLWSQARLDALPLRLDKFTRRLQPAITLDVVQTDPDDNRVLECAVTAGSQFIVTGNNHLLDLGRYSAIQIVKVADFMKLIPSP